jgi:ABC-2 type transport system ATP-binding protein
VADLGSGPAQVDAQAGEVTVPIADGVVVLPEVVRQLDATGLGLSDLMVRRPTLDDVFLTLTGHATQPPDPSEAPATGQPRLERQPATRSLA